MTESDPKDSPETAPRRTVDPSREMRRSRALRRFRWLVLLAMVAAVVLVVGIYLAGRSERPRGPGEELEDDGLEPTGEMVTVGEGFEYTATDAEREIFTIRGDRYSVNKEGIVFLEGVEVVIDREEGARYEVEGARGRFDEEKRQGRLGGGVRIRAPDGLELTTESLRITDGGDQIRSRSPVAFQLGDGYRGTAEGLRAWLTASRFVLDGLVAIDSTPEAEEPLEIRAKGMILERERQLLRSQDWAVLRRRGERLSALEMHFFFAEDERTLRFVRAERKVTGLLRSGGSVDLGDSGARRLGFQADKLTLLMTDDGRHPQRLELEKGPGGRARVYTLGPAPATRHRLIAPSIGARFDENGVASRVEATGGVVLVMLEPGEAGVDEEALGAPPDPEEAGDRAPAEPEVVRRQATAREAEASFGPAGDLATVEMRGDVTLEDGRVEARGDRGVFDAVEETAELFGRPAVATGDRGRMEAPRILYTRDSGIVHGTRGVRTRIDDVQESALGGSPLASGDGPVWVEADVGYLRDEPRSFLFVGNVRAWRGDDLLVAEELRGDEAEDRLTATGGVRTLWTPEQESGESGDGPIEVTAEQLVHRSADRLLVYTGDVVAEQAGRVVAGREMTLTMAAEGGVERLVATGGVRVDEAGGRSLRGERAVYDPVARTIDVSAAPGGKVIMKDGDGSIVEGPRMRYDIDEDRVRVIGREGPAAGPGSP